jgi:hypothetical protein
MMVTDKIYFCVSFLRSLHEELAIVDYSLLDMNLEEKTWAIN